MTLTTLASAEQQRYIAFGAPVLLWSSGTDAACNWFNSQWLEFTGRTIEEELGYGWAAGVHEDDYEHCVTVYVSAFRERLPFTMEYRLRRFDGQYRWIMDTGVPQFDEQGRFLGYTGACVDITERKEIEERLRISEQRFRLLFDSVNDSIFVHGLSEDGEPGRFVEVNAHACNLLGYTKAELLQLSHLEIDAARTSRESVSRIVKELREKGKMVFETYHRHRDGHLIPMEVKAHMIMIDEQPLVLSVGRDITERKQNEERLLYLSYHDPLTGLYNRAWFDQELARLNTLDVPVAIIMCDVDGLKIVNDFLGHHAGDKLLTAAGEVLRQSCREEDAICRIGGDEFAILVIGESNWEAVDHILSAILRLAEELSLASSELHLGISLGAAVRTDGTTDVYTLVREADNRMYSAKTYQRDKSHQKIREKF